MTARAIVIAPDPGGKPVSREQVVEALAAAKVIFGIDQEAIDQLVQWAAEGRRLDREGVVLAVGEPPVPGEDGSIIHHPMLETPSGYPRLREDGRADFFDLNVVRNVEKEVVLATRKPPTRGQPGRNVLGQPLQAPDGRDVRLRAGQGTRLSADGQSVISTIEGHASISYSGEVTVSPIFAVSGDVGYATGNIDFVGTVIVRGDITPGFTVKAGQNVQVHGGVLGGSVEAGGDVVVRYGITGARSRVTAGGKVQCRFIEGAEVLAGGDVTVADGILNARVSGENVQVTSGRGSIVGGLIRATHSVGAQVLGAERGTATDIQVGVAPAVRIELARSLELLADVKGRLQAAESGTSLQKRLSAAEKEQIAARVAALQAQMHPEPGANVTGYDTVYPGVRVAIGAERYIVLDPSTNTRFYIGDDGTVTIGSAY